MAIIISKILAKIKNQIIIELHILQIYFLTISTYLKFLKYCHIYICYSTQFILDLLINEMQKKS